MNAALVNPKRTNFKSPRPKFNTLEEVVKYKTDIANKMLAKIDREVLENVGK